MVKHGHTSCHSLWLVHIWHLKSTTWTLVSSIFYHLDIGKLFSFQKTWYNFLYIFSVPWSSILLLIWNFIRNWILVKMISYLPIPYILKSWGFFFFFFGLNMSLVFILFPALIQSLTSNKLTLYSKNPTGREVIWENIHHFCSQATEKNVAKHLSPTNTSGSF